MGGGSQVRKFRFVPQRLHTPVTESPAGSGSTQWCVQSLRAGRELTVGFGRWDAMPFPACLHADVEQNNRTAETE